MFRPTTGLVSRGVERPRKGNAGEAAVLNALVQRGFDVFLPFGDGHPFDLVVLAANRFVRIQCKTAWAGDGCLLFNSHSTDHGRGIGSYAGIADVFGVYFPPLASVFLIPVTDVPKHEGRLRLKRALNHQRRRVRRAEDYLIDMWTAEALSELARASASFQSAA
jgi:hypothetical protein